MARNLIIDSCVWPLKLLEQALVSLIDQVGFSSPSTPINSQLLTPLQSEKASPDELQQWIEQVGERLNVDILPTHCQYDELTHLLAQAAPAIIKLSGKHNGFVVIKARKWGKLVLLMPSAEQQMFSVAELRDFLQTNFLQTNFSKTNFSKNNIEAHSLADLSASIATLPLSDVKRQKVLKGLLQQRLAHHQVGEGWLIRLPVGSPLIQQLKQANYPQKLLFAIGAMVTFHLLLILSWYAIGQSLFQTTSYHHMYPIWALLLLSAIPFYYLSLTIKNRLSLDFGALMRKRMLDGLLKLTAKEVQQQSSGQFLSRVMDVEALEAQSFGMAFVVVTALIQLSVALVVLSFGAGGVLHSLLLLVLLAGIGYLSYRYYGYVQCWMAKDRQMTGQLAENMVGHRTRLAQQDGDYHQQEDQNLTAYTELSRQLDNFSALVFTVAGRRVWLLLSLLVLYSAFINHNETLGIELLSISVGGVLLAAISLDQLANSIRYLLEAKCAWQQLQPLYDSASRTHSGQQTKVSNSQTNAAPLLQAINIDFAHGNRPILQQSNIVIGAGDKILLQGSSGAGKSTLAHVLAGLYQPCQGELKLNGLSYADVGDMAWRQKVLLTPQFHQNYIFAETLAFNLLMGRRWPPHEQDLIAAQQVCRALNLGHLLDTMPAGLQQMIGECGWNLSHGERSRIYVARALLQQADLIILDESFASLDPNNLKIALNCVLNNSKAILLAAHP